MPVQLVEMNLWEEGSAWLSFPFHTWFRKRNQSSHVKRLAECCIHTRLPYFRRHFVALPVGEGSAPVWLILQKSPRDVKHKQIIKMFIYVVAERWRGIDQTFGSNGPSFCQWFTSSKILWIWGTQTASVIFFQNTNKLTFPLSRGSQCRWKRQNYELSQFQFARNVVSVSPNQSTQGK